MAFGINVTEPYYLGDSGYTAVGVFLIVTGLLSGIMNFAALAGTVVGKRGPSLIPEAALWLVHLGIAGLHPFSATAALSHRWVWGPAGCQTYAFFGFLFGNFTLSGPALLILDRILIHHDPPGRWRNVEFYMKLITGTFANSLIWAVAPVLGWGRFGVTLNGISCTLSMTAVDAGSVTYLTAYTTAAFILPLFVAVIAILLARFPRSISSTCSKMEMWLWTGLPALSFTPYGMACFWPLVFGPPPLWLVTICPLAAKVGSMLHPFLHAWGLGLKPLRIPSPRFFSNGRQPSAMEKK